MAPPGERGGQILPADDDDGTTGSVAASILVIRFGRRSLVPTARTAALGRSRRPAGQGEARATSLPANLKLTRINRAAASALVTSCLDAGRVRSAGSRPTYRFAEKGD